MLLVTIMWSTLEKNGGCWAYILLTMLEDSTWLGENKILGWYKKWKKYLTMNLEARQDAMGNYNKISRDKKIILIFFWIWEHATGGISEKTTTNGTKWANSKL